MRALKVGSLEAAHIAERSEQDKNLAFLHTWTCPACGVQYDIYREPEDDISRAGDTGESDLVAMLHRQLVLECSSSHPTIEYRTEA